MMNTGNSHKRALVIEDEPVIGLVCERTLVSEGYEVDIAVNGSVAKEMVDENQYDLFLSDIRMPEMDGIELFHYIGGKNPDLLDKYIFTTGDVLSDNVSQFLEIANRPCLLKPFRPDRLKQVLRDFIEKA